MGASVCWCFVWCGMVAGVQDRRWRAVSCVAVPWWCRAAGGSTWGGGPVSPQPWRVWWQWAGRGVDGRGAAGETATCSSLPSLRTQLHSQVHPSTPPSSTHRWQAVWLWHVRVPGHPALGRHTTHEDSHWRKAVPMPTLPAPRLTVRGLGSSHCLCASRPVSWVSDLPSPCPHTCQYGVTSPQEAQLNCYCIMSQKLLCHITVLLVIFLTSASKTTFCHVLSPVFIKILLLRNRNISPDFLTFLYDFSSQRLPVGSVPEALSSFYSFLLSVVPISSYFVVLDSSLKIFLPHLWPFMIYCT